MPVHSPKRRYEPGLYRELADKFGADVAYEFCLSFGGMHIRVPLKFPRRGWLAKYARREVVEWLMEKYGNVELDVPLGPASDFNARIGRIDSLIRQGSGTNTIARELHCSRRTVQRRRAALLASEKQIEVRRPQHPAADALDAPSARSGQGSRVREDRRGVMTTPTPERKGARSSHGGRAPNPLRAR